LLKEHDVEYRYRETTEEPLKKAELKKVLAMLGVGPRDVLRKRDAKKQGLTGDETDAQLITLMAAHPTLIERPIAVKSGRAVLGRPIETILELL
jgi:arsenate reductase